MENRKRIFVFVLILLVLLFGGLSVYLYMQKGNLTKAHEKLNNEFKGLEDSYKAAVGEIQTVTTATDAEKLSAKYNTFTLLSKCGVGLSYPDETQRFDAQGSSVVADGENRAWRLNYNKIGDDDKFSYDYSIFKGGEQYSLILRNDNEASGYVAGYVEVNCIENKAGESLDTITNKYLAEVKKRNKAEAVNAGISASSAVVKKDSTIDKWGVKVDKLSISLISPVNSPDKIFTEYMFLANNKIYHLTPIGETTEKKALKSITSIVDSIYLYK